MRVRQLLILPLLLVVLMGCQSGGNTPAATGSVASAVTTEVPSVGSSATAPTPTYVPTTVAATAGSAVPVATGAPTVTPELASPTPVAAHTAAPELASPTPVATPTSLPVPPTATSAPSATAEPTMLPSPSPTTAPAGVGPGGVIFFVDTDGVTIKTIHPDGTHQFVLLRQPGVKVVSDLAADPSGTYLLFNGDGTEYLVQRGQGHAIGTLAGLPRWAPDGKRFVAALPQANGWHLFVYDAAAGAGTDLGVPGFAPDWFPDNQQLVYVNNGDVWRFDLQGKATTRLTHLPTDQEHAWVVQTPHVLPDGQHIIFFGGVANTLGASGNGQQWWSLPVAGGQPQPWTELGTDIAGNGVLDYGLAPKGDALAWSEGAHASACESNEVVTLSTTGLAGNTRLTKGLGELDSKRGPSLAVRGLSWAPDNNHLALALQPYDCNPNSHATPDPVTGRPNTGPSQIFLWNVRPNNVLGQFVAPTLLVNGSYPVWTR